MSINICIIIILFCEIVEIVDIVGLIKSILIGLKKINKMFVSS
jgi:hypothetical protein